MRLFLAIVNKVLQNSHQSRLRLAKLIYESNNIQELKTIPSVKFYR